MKSTIEEQTRKVFRRQWRAGVRDGNNACAADALVELVAGEPAGEAAPKEAAPYTTHIVIDHPVLQRGHALPGETCEIAGVGPGMFDRGMYRSGVSGARSL